MSNVPFFVLGSPRSGTSWLAQVIDAHPRLFCGLELDLLTAFSKVARTRAAHGSEDRLKGGPVVLRDGAMTLAALHVRDIARYEQERSGKARFGDKTPSYAGNMGLLGQMFPDAQAVHIIRDGREVVSSILHNVATEHNWRTEDWVPRSVELAAAYWWQHVALAQRSGATWGPGRYMEVRYEDLMADPLRAGGEVFAFLNEAMAPEVVARLQTAKSKPDSWSFGLSPREIRRFEAVPGIGAALVSLGYPLRSVPEPTPAVVAAAVAQAAAEFVAGRPDQARATIYAAADVGVDEAPLWALLARIEAEAGRPAVAANLRVRVLRNFPLDQKVCEELLGQAELPQSVFAATLAVRHGAPAALRAPLLRWLGARGVDEAGGRAFLGSLRPPAAPPAAAHALAPIARVRAVIRLGEAVEWAPLLPGLRAALSDPSLVGEARLALAEVAMLREDPQVVMLLQTAVAAGSLNGAVRALGLPRTQTSLNVLPVALSRVEVPRVRDAAKGWLEGRGLDADAANAMMHALWFDAQESLLR